MYEFAVTPAVTQLRRAGVIITEVTEGSIAADVGLVPNDRITKVNGRAIRDYLDFRFQTSGETELTLIVKKEDGETWEVEIEREEGEDFGLMFEQIVPRQCANECLFCFCKGNPEDARPSLFVRDEDIRLSFLYGNYTTLSSITPDEMSRIVEQRLSPQYVSVHATDLKTRAYLLGVDEKRADISDKIDFLLENDIEIHAQVVLCPEINDGEILERTLRDLAARHPKIVSAAIVPVALTRYNTDKRLTKVTPRFCERTIKQVEKLQKEFRKTLGATFAFLGDEIYIKAGAPIPSRRHYGNYPQIEDGVGMIRSFANAVESRLKKLEGVGGKSRLNGTILTGEMFAPILSGHVERINAVTGSRLRVLPVPNGYFGGDVSVAGLLTGQDIVKVKDSVEGDFVVIPSHIIKSDEPILIDGMSFDDLKKQFDVPVIPQDVDGFLEMIRSGVAEEGEYFYIWQNNPRNQAAVAHPAIG
jgi:putative radical SAM enzyme (TIGR03279 family)